MTKAFTYESYIKELKRLGKPIKVNRKEFFMTGIQVGDEYLIVGGEKFYYKDQMRKCGKCSELGHNRRTCEK